MFVFRRFYLCIFLFLVMVLFLSSCKNRRLFRSSGIKSVDLYDSIVAQRFDYKTAEFKFSAKYISAKQNLGFSGVMKLEKDEAIWASLSPGLGIELARVLLTTDSIWFMNRVEGSYFKDDYGRLDSMNIDLALVDLQRVLLNDLFIYPKQESEEAAFSDYILEQGAGFYRLLSVDSVSRERQLFLGESVLEQRIRVNSQTYKVERVLVKDHAKNQYLSVDYSDFKMFDFGLFPQSLEFSVVTPGDTLELNLQYKRITFDEPVNMRFKIPSRYKRIR